MIFVIQIKNIGHEKLGLFVDGIKLHSFTQTKYNGLLPHLLGTSKKKTTPLLKDEIAAIYEANHLALDWTEFIHMATVAMNCPPPQKSEDPTTGVKTNECIEYILEDHIWHSYHGILYRFEGYIYLEQSIPSIENKIMQWWELNYPDTYHTKIGEEVIKRIHIAKNLEEKELNQPNHIVAFKNGYFNIRTRMFDNTPNPNYHFFESYDFDYEPIFKTDSFQKKPILALFHLAQMFPTQPEIVDEILTASCLTLTNDVSYGKGFCLLGLTNCGKSTWVQILKEIMGKNGAAKLTPRNFDKREREVVYGDFVDKHIAWIDEAESKEYWSADTLAGTKHLITTPDLTSRKLNKNNSESRNKTHVWITANYLSRLAEYTTDWGRRWGGCWYSNTSFVGNVDLDRVKDILQNEKSALVNYLFTNYCEFSRYEQDHVEETLDFWRYYASNVFKFIRDECVIGSDKKGIFSSLYTSYCTYCRTISKEEPLYENLFSRQLTQRGFDLKRIGQDKIIMCMGIDLKPIESDHPTSKTPTTDPTPTSEYESMYDKLVAEGIIE